MIVGLNVFNLIRDTNESQNKKCTVYISPSKQTENTYAAGDTTEAEQMYKVGERVYEILQDKGIDVYMPELSYDSLSRRVKQSERYGAQVYVAIHSNAGGGEGTECFYNTENPKSKALAECVYEKAADITPTEDRGLKDGKTQNLYEVITPECASCLLEVEFHDEKNKAQWICENTEKLAKAIADGIIEYLTEKE